MHFSAAYAPRKDNGEDASLYIEGKCLAVFDGMGGAGGMKVSTADGRQHSMAFFASRICADTFRTVLDSFYDDFFLPEKQTEMTNLLRLSFVDDIQRFVQEHNIQINTRIKGNMFKLFPTTMAAIVFREQAEEVEVALVWAGDSRCYAWTETDGLLQLTADHLQMDYDALENIRNDAAISNHISLNTPFELHIQQLRLPKPVILFAATDGVFNYLPSPIHVEKVLLQTFFESGPYGECLIQGLDGYIHDDTTLEGECFGYDMLPDVLPAMKQRLTELDQRFFSIKSEMDQTADGILVQSFAAIVRDVIKKDLAEIKKANYRPPFRSVKGYVSQFKNIANPLLDSLRNADTLKNRYAAERAVLESAVDRSLCMYQQVNFDSVASRLQKTKQLIQLLDSEVKTFAELMDHPEFECVVDDRMLAKPLSTVLDLKEQLAKAMDLQGQWRAEFNRFLERFPQEHAWSIITLLRSTHDRDLSSELRALKYQFIQRRLTEEQVRLIFQIEKRDHIWIDKAWSLYKPTYEKWLNKER